MSKNNSRERVTVKCIIIQIHKSILLSTMYYDFFQIIFFTGVLPVFWILIYIVGVLG